VAARHLFFSLVDLPFVITRLRVHSLDFNFDAVALRFAYHNFIPPSVLLLELFVNSLLHTVDMVNFMLPLRGAQCVFTVVVLGLTAYGK